jgi:hypothetical protein
VIDLIDFWCFNATCCNITAISWRPALVVEEAGVPGEEPPTMDNIPTKFGSNCPSGFREED